MKLYFTGLSPQAETFVNNLRDTCEAHFPGQYHIEVVDLLERPQLAIDEQIFAAPTIVRKLPMPVRKVIGDLSDAEEVLVGLDLLPKKQSKHP